MREIARHAVLLSLGVVLVGASGCKAVRKWLSPAEGVELASPDAVSTVNEATLSDPQARRGLEVRMLVVDDTDYDAPRLLRAFDALPASAIGVDVQERWARWGFRVVEIPVDQLDSTLGSLTPVRPVSVQWLGEFGGWRALIRAGYSEQSLVRVGESSRTIEPGRPRLIARSWIEPMLTDSGRTAVLRLDLGMQIENDNRSSFVLLPDQRARTLDDDGQVIDELLSSLTLRGDHAVVIIGEAPGSDWDELPEPTPVEVVLDENEASVGPEGSEAESDGVEAEARPAPRPFASGTAQPLGPRTPALRSLGELMLVAQGSRLTRANETRDIPRRVLIVLVPSVRGDFEMLSIPAAGGGS